jgi:squalene-hopene/tetraprenyl-beta-curcumene cyclase
LFTTKQLMRHPPTSPSIREAWLKARSALLGARVPAGHWTGELSSSALSTATAVSALAMVERESGSESASRAELIAHGLRWLATHANADGGWGDTVISISNISTTTLVWSAFGLVPGADEAYASTLGAAVQWLKKHAGDIDPDSLSAAIIRRYGKDRTFSVPILTTCAIAGRLGSGKAAWRHVIPLPFELAAVPHRFFAALRLPVVSYALPALIAIGQARHHHAPSWNPFARLARAMTRRITLRVLTSIQPVSGGFLEATPLTSFVALSLAASGQVDHPVTRQAIAFLAGSVRPDGSWPIDTNLATWLTTLAVNALSGDREFPLDPSDAEPIRRWLLGQQYRSMHPYTHAAPGGWAWTDLSGGVPDADDTAGALIALKNLGETSGETVAAAAAGVQWLMDLQNADGGIPTFCRGWTNLPFDRSSADLTAHALRAWQIWREEFPEQRQERIRTAMKRAVAYLDRTRAEDGSWAPLWFGNQSAIDDSNPTYGTAKVLLALSELSPSQFPLIEEMAWAAAQWLLKAQAPEGGWSGFAGGPVSIEETALAIESLCALVSTDQVWKVSSPMIWNNRFKEVRQSCERGAGWLAKRVETGEWLQPAPIGFYFAKLWYFERLYPVIFTTAALNRASRLL